MKHIKRIPYLMLHVCLVLLGLLHLTSCSIFQDVNPQVDSKKVVDIARAWIDDSAREITKYVLRTQASPDGKQQYVKVLRATSTTLRAISIGQEVPTEKEFERVILEIAPDTKYVEIWPSVASALASLYASASPHFPENAKVALELVGLLAKGIDQGLASSGYAALEGWRYRLHPAMRIWREHADVLEHYAVRPEDPFELT